MLNFSAAKPSMVKPVTVAPRTSGHFHAVRFYDSNESLCRIVAEFIGEGLVVREPGLIIAAPEHRAGIVDALQTRYFDVERMRSAGHLVMLDASQVLRAFMVDGMPNPDLFSAYMADTLARLCGGFNRRVRAYGEMVDILWGDGHADAAIRLEMLWNRLALTHDFSLLCGYAMGNFYKNGQVGEICHQHTHAVGPDGTAIANGPRCELIN
jgi:hypothetical protein